MDALFRRSGRKKRNGFLWASLISLGVSAAAFVLKRKGKPKTDTSLESILNTFRLQNSRSQPAAGTAEIANELAPIVKDFFEENSK